jgi:cysteinyl-tRNA synthetase
MQHHVAVTLRYNSAMGPLLLHNTLTRRKEEFTPSDGKTVRMYCCGPTVYNFQHIGNLRTYMFEDLLHRVLLSYGWAVKHVMNITDVGHMTSDGDAGEDKMEKAAAREGKTPWEIARYYEEIFFRDSARLNIIKPSVAPRATEHVEGMIELIKKLESKGYTYSTPEGVYFDTSRDADYGKLAGLNLAEQKAGAREDLNVDPAKRHPADFILWFTNKPGHIMKWESPWGTGYPGWHIECSAMSMEYLGETLDIHCGGTDHIPVHNTNEIAQSECATDKMFARFWLHGAFLIVEKPKVKDGDSATEDDAGGVKMAKSAGNFLTVDALIEKGFDPLAYRYMCLMAHYRSELKFSWETVEAASTALGKIWELKARQTGGDGLSDEQLADARKTVEEALADDLNLPRAVAALQEAKSYRLWSEFDHILGLDIEKRSRSSDDDELPTDVTALMAERDAARKARNWAASDDLRNKIEALGYTVGDSPAGTTVKKKLL